MKESNNYCSMISLGKRAMNFKRCSAKRKRIALKFPIDENYHT